MTISKEAEKVILEQLGKEHEPDEDGCQYVLYIQSKLFGSRSERILETTSVINIWKAKNTPQYTQNFSYYKSI